MGVTIVVGRGRMRFSFEKLAEALSLPEGTEILGLKMAKDHHDRPVVELTVESPGLPGVPPSSRKLPYYHVHHGHFSPNLPPYD